MTFSISYRATYRYDGPVSDEHDVLRLTPQTGETQRVHAFELAIEPAARLFRHRDYFGTEAVSINIAEPHDGLKIAADARVATRPAPEPPDAEPEALEDEAYRRAGGEFLLPWSTVGRAEELAGLIEAVRRPRPLETLIALTETIPARFAYRRGATYVGSTIDDLLEGGAGVCQDFAHLALAILRRLGIAGRYVSGYLFVPNGNADGNASAEVDTHAWVEALLPDGDGGPRWVGIDPTNAKLAGADHVKIGHGRNYADVPPLRGVYRGQARAEHEVKVRMVNLDA
jgi:transglutaminase-like putative cysteine protease